MAEGYSAQEQEWKAHADKELAERRCPFSGEPLVRVLDAWQMDSLMCELCDCFGYAPDDPRVGPDKT